MWTGIAVYICPILSKFHKKNMELIRTALYVLFRYLPLTIGIQLVFVIVCVGIFLMPPVEEDSEEVQKWYYQSPKSTENKDDSEENKIGEIH